MTALTKPKVCRALRHPNNAWHVLTANFLETEENLTPDFEVFDLAVTTAPAGAGNWHANHAVNAVAPMGDVRQALCAKTKFCAFIFHNRRCATRNRFLEILSQHHRIDSAGKVLGNQPRLSYPIARTMEFYRPYKFVVAFENSLGLHYTSEKLWQALNARTVPIYWGNPQIATWFNPERFINAFDFDTLDSLAAHVMRVHEDDELYLRYLSQPSRTVQQEQAQLAQCDNSEQARRVRRNFATARTHLLTGRALPLAQRHAFHREVLSRCTHKACNHIFEERLVAAGWHGMAFESGRHRVSRHHVWPHPVFYKVVDMHGRLQGKA